MKYKKEMNLFQENRIKKETHGLNKFREKGWSFIVFIFLNMYSQQVRVKSDKVEHI